MGLFDEVYLHCPECGEIIEAQSKAGECSLRAYTEDSVAAFSRNPATGALSFVEFKQDGVEGVDGLDGAIGVAISPGVKHLYAAGYFDDAVAAFSRNPTTGTLNFVELKKDCVGGVDGLDGGWSVTISLGGKHLYAASYLARQANRGYPIATGDRPSHDLHWIATCLRWNICDY